MGIFDDIRRNGAAYRITEEALYAEALRECEAGIRRDGLWAKALARSGMKQEEAQAYYLKLRVQSLRDEINLVLHDIESNRTVETIRREETSKIRATEFGNGAAVDLPKMSRTERIVGRVVLGFVLAAIAIGVIGSQEWLIQIGLGLSLLWLIWWLRKR